MSPRSRGEDASSPLPAVLQGASFLELYPHPAFAVLHREPLSPLSHSHDTDYNGLNVVWSNGAWNMVAGSRPLLECVVPTTVGPLTAWLGAPADQRRPFVLEMAPPSTQRYQLARTTIPAALPNEPTVSYTVVTTIPCRSSEEDEVQATDGAQPAAQPPAPTSPIVASTSGSPEEARALAQQSPQSPQEPQFKPFDPPVRPPGEVPGSQPVGFDVPDSMRTVQALRIGTDGKVRLSPPSNRHRTGISSSGRPYDVKMLLAHSVDWSATPLGPRETWSIGMQTLIAATLSSPNMCSLWCGRQFTWIYNQHFANVMAQDHPESFGRHGPESWAEIYRILGPMTEVLLTGQGLHLEDFFVPRRSNLDGKVYEVYCTQHWVVCREVNGDFIGFFLTGVDTTPKVLAQRRSEIARRLTGCASVGRTMQDFDTGVLQILEDNPKDAPFAMLYHVDLATTFTATRRSSRRDSALDAHVTLNYVGGVGVPSGYIVDPVTVTLKPGNSPNIVSQPFDDDDDEDEEDRYRTLPRNARMRPSLSAASEPNDNQWPFLEALTTRRVVVVRDCRALIKGFDVRVWDELPTSAVVIPITRDSDEGVPRAVLVLGISTRLPFDEGYKTFVDLLRLQVASFLVAIRSYLQDRELIQRLAEVDQAKNLLFANVANDLLAPISLVFGPLDDLMADVAHNPTASNLLNIARRNVRSLRAIVRMLIEVSSLARGSGIMTFTRVNLGSLTRDMASMFRKSIEKNGVQYTIDCDLTPREVFVDREAWEKIVVTTIGMSAKYTRQGFIKVRVRYANSQAIIEFQNSSTGLPKHMMETIGELTYQSARDETPAGAIVHFALLKKLIDLHGGTLEVESASIKEATEQSGLSMSICLPLGSSHLPQEDIQVDSETPPHDLHLWEDWEDTALETPSTIERRSWGVDPSTLYFEKTDVILLVEDNIDSLRYMRAIFEPFCTVIEARSVQQALELCSSVHPPDLVIADLMLPYEHGDVLLANLRNGTRVMQMIPLIMLTPHDDSRTEFGLPAEDYLARPFNARDLLSRGHMQLQLGKRRRDLEARFEERTAELRALMDESPMGILRAGADGKLVYANASWYNVAGYAPDGPSDDWSNYIDDDFRDGLLKTWAEFRGDCTKLTKTVTAKWKNGAWMTIKLVKLFKSSGGSGGPTTAPGRDNTLVGYIGCSMDISEHKLNEKLQIERAMLAEHRRREAEEAKAQQELLIDITSHEIRNPISSLMQCASLVKTNLLGLQDDLSEAATTGAPYVPTDQLLQTIREDLDALDSIHECALTQERISNDVLSLGKIQLELLQMFDVETHIHAEAQKIFNVFQNEARINRIQMSLRFSDAFENLGVVTVKLDPVRYGQIVTNLFANAIRFVTASEERRIDVRIDIGTVPPPEGTCTKPVEPDVPTELGQDRPLYLYTEVADTGPGLSPAALETLFQRFKQGNAQTHTVFGGSGLGLFVCRKLAELMGGRIEVASEYTRGSMFRFFIETCLASTSAVAPHPLRQPVHHAPRPATSGSHKMRRILIVEDNVINRKVLQRQLKHVGLKPDSVGNGLEAVERLRALDTVEVGYDCVLMDLEMPVMDGYAATRLLRNDEAGGRPGNAIIALTGNARQAQLVDRMADFDDVVVKPYRLDSLLSTIESVIKARERAARAQASAGRHNGASPRSGGGMSSPDMRSVTEVRG